MIQNKSTFDKPVKIPQVEKTALADPQTYVVSVFPFSDEPVRIFFLWVKVPPAQHWPDGWIPYAVRMEGNQINGLDLDACHIKIGPYFWSFREYLFSVLYGICSKEYGGKSAMDMDYGDQKGNKIINLDT